MASPGELVKKISQVTGINEATVASTHRYLRDSGLVTKGGRGNSSAKMTPADASNLAIALLAATAINDSPEVVERYGQLQMRRHDFVCNLAEFWNENEPKIFAVCVRRLIEAFSSGQVAEVVSNISGTQISASDLDFSNIDVSVGIARPNTEAFVCVSAVVIDGDEIKEVPILSFKFERSFVTGGGGGTKIVPRLTSDEMIAGLQERRWIDFRVIKAISEIL